MKPCTLSRADDQPVGQPDHGGDRQRDERPPGSDVAGLAGHDPAGDQAGQADDERHREVEAADQDHQGLPDRDEAQDAGRGQDRRDVAGC